MTQNILLIGDGILADYVHDRLCKQYSIVRQHTIADELPEKYRSRSRITRRLSFYYSS